MAVNGISEQARQEKYATSAKVAYGLSRSEDKMRLLSYFATNQNKGHDKYVFYKTGNFNDKAQDYFGANNQQKNYNGTSYGYDDIAGVDITDFTKGVAVIPTTQNLPFWKGKDEDNRTTLNVDGDLLRAQTAGLLRKTMFKILEPIAKFTDAAGFDRIDSKGNVENIKIDKATRVFGDSTKSFKENEEAFFNMLSELENLSNGTGAESKVALLIGTKTNGILKAYDRTTNRDYITTSEFESKQGTKFAVKKFDIAEMIQLREFDAVINPTTGKVRIVALLQGAMGYDAHGEPEAETDYFKQKRAFFYNLTETNGATIVDEEGIFVFEYNGSLEPAVAPVALSAPTSTRTATK